jgi:hypothetical protein
VPHTEFAPPFDFTKPKGFLTGDDNVPTYLHKALKSAQVSLAVVTDTTASKAIAVMTNRKKVTHLLERHEFKLCVNDELENESFEECATMDPYVIIQRANAYSGLVDALPTGGTASFLTCNHGYCWVTFLDIQNVLDNNYSLDAVTTYLEEVDSEYLGKMTSFGLQKGQSAFCPTGYLPALVGLQVQEDEVDAEFDYTAVTIFPVLDVKSLPNIPPAVLVELKGWFTKANAKNLKVLKETGGSKAALKKFVEMLPDKAPNSPEVMPTSFQTLPNGSND